MTFARRMKRNRNVTEGACQFCKAPAAAVRVPGVPGFHAYHADPICPQWQEMCESRGGQLLDKQLSLDEYEDLVRKTEAN